jgi:hypothetical protein
LKKTNKINYQKWKKKTNNNKYFQSIFQCQSLNEFVNKINFLSKYSFLSDKCIKIWKVFFYFWLCEVLQIIICFSGGRKEREKKRCVAFYKNLSPFLIHTGFPNMNFYSRAFKIFESFHKFKKAFLRIVSNRVPHLKPK